MFQSFGVELQIKLHKTKLVNAWIKENRSKIELFFLPQYIPKVETGISVMPGSLGFHTSLGKMTLAGRSSNRFPNLWLRDWNAVFVWVFKKRCWYYFILKKLLDSSRTKVV